MLERNSDLARRGLQRRLACFDQLALGLLQFADVAGYGKDARLGVELHDRSRNDARTHAPVFETEVGLEVAHGAVEAKLADESFALLLVGPNPQRSAAAP